MKRLNLLVFAFVIAAMGSALYGRSIEHRSRAARAAFQRSHACPSTGKPKGACPGYVVDHINPLACGGADLPSNMQWQTTEEAKLKDKWERNGCKPPR